MRMARQRDWRQAANNLDYSRQQAQTSNRRSSLKGRIGVWAPTLRSTGGPRRFGTTGQEPDMPEQFDIEIVYGVNKPLKVTEEETIQQVKLGAMAEFGVPASEANQYVLRTKIDGKDHQLNEQETVEQAKLHPHQKVTLAAGTPYGRR